MSGGGWKRGFIAVLVGVVLALGGLAGQPAAFAKRPGGSGGERQGEDLYGCDRTFGKQPEGHLKKRTAPVAGRDVTPGETVTVVITWDKQDWSSSELHKVLDCVAIDGELVRELQDGESPTDNDGRFRRDYAVPDDAPDGAQICDQAMLSGPSPRGDYDRQISNQVCHRVVRGGQGSCGAKCDNRCDDKSPCRGGCDDKSSCSGSCGEKTCDRRGCGEDAGKCGDQGDGCGADGCGEKCRCEQGDGDQSDEYRKHLLPLPTYP